MKEQEPDRACSTHGVDEKCTVAFKSENLKIRYELKDPSLGGRTILK